MLEVLTRAPASKMLEVLTRAPSKSEQSFSKKPSTSKLRVYEETCQVGAELQQEAVYLSVAVRLAAAHRHHHYLRRGKKGPKKIVKINKQRCVSALQGTGADSV